MKTEFLSEMLVIRSLVEDSVLNGARRERQRENDIIDYLNGLFFYSPF